MGGVPNALKYMGLRSMIHLCEKVVLMGPMGLIFALYNQQIQRTKDLQAAIAAAEKKSAEDRAAKEEEERLQALEDAKNKKKAKPKKKKKIFKRLRQNIA